MKATIALMALLSASTCAIASDTPSVPESGSYAASIFVDGTNLSSYCLDYAGEQYAGQVSFAGLSGTTDYVRVPLTNYGEAIASVQTLTVTSGKGTTKPSGKFAWTGQGFGASWNENGTFSADITEIGTHVFVMTVAENYSGCVENLNISLVRVSADQ